MHASIRCLTFSQQIINCLIIHLISISYMYTRTHTYSFYILNTIISVWFTNLSTHLRILIHVIHMIRHIDQYTSFACPTNMEFQSRILCLITPDISIHLSSILFFPFLWNQRFLWHRYCIDTIYTLYRNFFDNFSNNFEEFFPATQQKS